MWLYGEGRAQRSSAAIRSPRLARWVLGLVALVTVIGVASTFQALEAVDDASGDRLVAERMMQNISRRVDAAVDLADGDQNVVFGIGSDEAEFREDLAVLSDVSGVTSSVDDRLVAQVQTMVEGTAEIGSVNELDVSAMWPIQQQLEDDYYLPVFDELQAARSRARWVVGVWAMVTGMLVVVGFVATRERISAPG